MNASINRLYCSMVKYAEWARIYDELEHTVKQHKGSYHVTELETMIQGLKFDDISRVDRCLLDASGDEFLSDLINTRLSIIKYAYMMCDAIKNTFVEQGVTCIPKAAYLKEVREKWKTTLGYIMIDIQKDQEVKSNE